ncbi:MAG: hypothetical protein ACHQVK_04985 [Candidatus Paceibacterales bacterium]
MVKFIGSLIDRLKDLKKGIHDNSGAWTGQPIAESDLDTAITSLEGKNDAITDAKAAVHEATTDAHTEVNTQEKLADQAESLARGIHAATPSKLAEYNIKERKTPENAPAPGKAVIASVVDDHDGIGFIITIQPLANAANFNIDRAMTDANVLTATPESFTHLKTTQKLTYVDDDVMPGKRYHYRVQASNRAGSGEMSAVVSAVQ